MTQPNVAQMNALSVVQAGYNNFAAGDVEALLDKMDDAVQWALPRIAGVRVSGTRSGRNAVRGFFRELDEDQQSVIFEPREFITEGDRVVTLGHYVWKVRATGKQYEGDFAHVFTVRDGRITRFTEFGDTAAVEEAYRP
jgi:ketosteroid isomerase-like protein